MKIDQSSDNQNNTPDESKEKEIWESWLDEKYGRKLEEIREAVTEIHFRSRKRHGDLPYYTPHGEEHCKAVENLIHRLIPGEYYKKLYLRERYILLASAWLHDIGMLPSIAGEILKNQDLTAEVIRKNHHITSARYIVDYWYNLKIDEFEKEVIAKLCLFHRKKENINECERIFLAKNSKYRLRLLASYLRLADSLHMDASRAPAEPYAICLAYDIPAESKMHWIKSKLVNGIDIDPESHNITIQYKIPFLSKAENSQQYESITNKIKTIASLVREDLQEELSSVINVITRSGPTYYLDIIEINSPIAFDSRMLNDLRELVINYDIMMAPSATKLLNITLVTIANMAGYSLTKYSEPEEFASTPKKQYGNTSNSISSFLKSLDRQLLSTRPCHLGLRNLIEKCENINSDSQGQPIPHKYFISEIDQLYQAHHHARREVRTQSSKFFANIKQNSKSDKINILLYGYSELVTKCICGLRDSILQASYKCDPKKSYNSSFEKECSELIHIFICECQPKTQTAPNDRLVYHDGSQYAIHLKERGFNNLYIIPDIISGSLLEKLKIDYLIIGANGVTEKYFTHSAGHLGIVNLVRENSNKVDGKKHKGGKIILTATEEKFHSNSDVRCQCNKEKKTDYIIDGSTFVDFPNFSAGRHQIWLTRDKKILEKINSNNIYFVNPREDNVPIEYTNYLITDKNIYHFPEGMDQFVAVFKNDSSKSTTS